MTKIPNWTLKEKYTSKSVLESLNRSRTMKIKNGWSREAGAGFVAEDVLSIARVKNTLLLFEFTWGTQKIQINELNLRETEEAIEFMKRLRSKRYGVV